MPETKSFLRWAGSKQKLLPYLSEYWNPSYNRYVEPFMGSAKLFFRLAPKQALISDLNAELIEVYNQIKEDPLSVYQALSEYNISSEDYYLIRAQNPATLDVTQRTARFLYLNRLCFNGLYRTNKNNQFNVPYSGEVPKQICDFANLQNVSERLQHCQIIQGDFEAIITNNIQENDFVYLDPPYAVRNVRIF
jgi:DNA adenine methylase